MRRYLTSITPDSLTGMVLAMEGVAHSVVLLNGPSGCKFYHSATSDNQGIHQSGFDPLVYPDAYFFGQPRVPCTYLDSHDYIYGSADKVEGALRFLAAQVPSRLICVINSPGAALIGDDLAGIARRVLPHTPCLVIETPGVSRDFVDGFEDALIALLDTVPAKKPDAAVPHVINILGLSIQHRYFRGDIAELRRLFALCGIRVGCVLGADCTLDEIGAMPQAALNVVIRPEYGARTARYLERRDGTPTLLCDGPPIGFSAAETLVKQVCTRLGAPVDAFLEEAEKARATAYAHVSRVSSMTGLPKGVPISVEGYPGDVLAYSRFLVRYFGMVLVCASVLGPDYAPAREALRLSLKELGMEGALQNDILQAPAEMVFASGNTIAALRLQRLRFCGVETALPSLGYIDVLPKTHLGLNGALLLTEQVLNGLLF